MDNTTNKADTLPGEVSDLAVRLRALSRAEHSDFSIGDEAADELLRLTREDEATTRRHYRVKPTPVTPIG